MPCGSPAPMLGSPVACRRWSRLPADRGAEPCLAKRREYGATNREKEREGGRQYRKDHPGLRHQRCEDNKERELTAAAAHRDRNRDRVRQHNRTRYGPGLQREKSLRSRHGLTLLGWQALFDAQGGLY